MKLTNILRHKSVAIGMLPVWLAASLLLTIFALSNAAQGAFFDVDDAMRLVQVRDLIAGQSWFDLHQYRLTPGDSPIMHWSRIVDVPIYLCLVVLTPIVGTAQAEFVTAIAVPLLTLLAVMVMVAKTAGNLFGKDAGTIAAILLCLCSAVMVQLMPQRIDHHGWQIFSIAAAMWGATLPNPLRGGIYAGLAMALGMSISIEVLPLAGALGAVFFLSWMIDARARIQLTAYMAALAAGLAVLFIFSHGVKNLNTYCDAISPAHIAFFVAAALGTLGIYKINPARPLVTLALFGLCGAAAFGVFITIAPQCASAPFGDLDPLVHRYWYIKVAEGLPIWRQVEPIPAIIGAVQLGGAIIIALILYRKTPQDRRPQMRAVLLMLIAASVVSLLVVRAMSFAFVIAAIPLSQAVQLARASLKKTAGQGAERYGWAIALGVILIAIPFAPNALPKEIIDPPRDARILAESNCRMHTTTRQLDFHTPGTIFSALDIAPFALYYSKHSVVASGHHRSKTAMRDVIAAFIAPPEDARKIVAAHGAQYLLICPDVAEALSYARANKAGLAARLLRGETPDWLSPITLSGATSLKFYRVESPANTPSKRGDLDL